jgi:cytochrome P450
MLLREGARMSSYEIHDPRLYASGAASEYFASLRQTNPVMPHYNRDGRRFWALARHRDQLAVIRDTNTFSTRHGLTFDTYSYDAPDPAADNMLEMSCPAVHKPLRYALDPAFRRHSIEVDVERVRQYVRYIFQRALTEGAFDFVRDVADPISSAVIFEMMGFPREDWDELFQLSRHSQERTYQALNPAPPFDSAAQAANMELLRYMMRLTDRNAVFTRRAHLTLLRELRLDGRALTKKEFVLNCLNILQGGNSTTAHAASGGVLALLEHPEQAEMLKSDRSLLNHSVEEVIRWTTPAIHFCRYVTQDVEIGGVLIPEGEAITLWLISANRDPEVFADADEFVIRRRPNRHLGFLAGDHRCLGSNVARMELRVILEEFVSNDCRLTIASEPQRVMSNFINGFESLQMRSL